MQDHQGNQGFQIKWIKVMIYDSYINIDKDSSFLLFYEQVYQFFVD